MFLRVTNVLLYLPTDLHRDTSLQLENISAQSYMSELRGQNRSKEADSSTFLCVLLLDEGKTIWKDLKNATLWPHGT